jgi:hypothetical protein
METEESNEYPRDTELSIRVCESVQPNSNVTLKRGGHPQTQKQKSKNGSTENG